MNTHEAVQNLSMDQLYARTLASFLAPIRNLIEDPTVSEIMINGHERIYVERRGRIQETDLRFRDDEDLAAAAKNIAQYVGRPLDRQHPALDGRLPDGSRIHILLPPASRQGVLVCIRKFFTDRLSISTLVKSGSLSAEAVIFLRECVSSGRNILISGGTGTGKTSLLNVLSEMIDPDERIILIEDAAEIQLRQPHVVSLETQAADHHGRGEMTVRDLFRSALRLRPDRVIIGELRGAEAIDAIQAMTSGHAGSMSTLHANSAYDALNRLETMALTSDIGLPLSALRCQIASAIDIVVQVARSKDGHRRVISISEVAGLTTSGQYLLQDLFQLEAGRGSANEHSPRLVSIGMNGSLRGKPGTSSGVEPPMAV